MSVRRGGIVWTVVALLGASACSRELELPAGQPRISTFSPLQAFYSDTLAVKGLNFDPVPARNTIEFSGGYSAPGDRFDADGALLVYVPFDVTEGPLTLVTPQGRSAPSDTSFVYRGGGHPAKGTQVADLKLRHNANGLGASATEIFLASQLSRSVVGSVGLPIPLGGKPLALTTGAGGLLIVGLDQEAAGPVLVDPVARMVVATGPLSGISSQIVLPGPGGASPIAVTVGTDGGGLLWAETFVHTGAQLVPARQKLGLWTASGAALLPDGRLLVLGTRPDPLKLAQGALLVDLGSQPAAPVWLAAPAGLRPTGQLAVVPGSPQSQVALALDDGTVALIALGSSPQWDPVRVQTGSARPIGGLTVVQPAGGDPYLLSSIPDDGLLVASSPGDHTRLWSVSLRGRPGAVLALAGAAFVNDDESNGVDVIDLKAATPHVSGRLPFSAGLEGPPGFSSVAATPPSDGNLGSQVWFLARKLRVVLPVDTYLVESGVPISLAAGASDARGLGAAPDGAIWVMHQSELGVVSSSGETVVTPSDLPNPPLALAFPAAGAVLVASERDVSLYRKAATGSSYLRQGTLDLPGRFVKLVATPAGEALVVWAVLGTNGVAAHAGLWTLDALAAGGAAKESWDPPAALRGFVGAAAQAGGAVLFFREIAATTGTNAPTPGFVALSGSLAASPARPAPLDEPGPLLTTPDTRFVLWARQQSGDRTLRLLYAWPGEPSYYDLGTWPLDADFAEVALDASGEWIFVPLLGRDEIIVLQ